MKTIPAKEFLELLAQDPELQVLDVRFEIEIRGQRLDGDVHYLSLGRMNLERVRAMIKDPAKPVYLICRTDNRSRQAAQILEEQGFKNAYVVEGGMAKCAALGGPVITAPIMSLERQTRIGAGLLVLLGIGLGAAIDPLLYLLAVFVGAGLVFAGVTDCCGMAAFLAKAPWNRNQS